MMKQKKSKNISKKAIPVKSKKGNVQKKKNRETTKGNGKNHPKNTSDEVCKKPSKKSVKETSAKKNKTEEHKNSVTKRGNDKTRPTESKEKTPKEPRKTTTRANKDRFYVTNAGLMAELIKWRKSAKNVEDRMPSEELGRMVMAIAQKICNHSFFRNYTKEIKEDMMQYAFYKIFSGLKNYNFNYKNPFAYISQGIFNAYRSELTRHYKQVNIKKAMTERVIRELEVDLPGSSIEKCLSKQYGVGDNDEPF